MSLIEETPSETVDALMAQVRSIPGRRKLRAWLMPCVMLVGGVAGLIGLNAAGYFEFWSSLATLGLVLVPCFWWWFTAERRDLRDVTALTAYKEKHTVGILLEALNYSNRRVRGALESVLLELLPHLTENDSALLNTGQREILNALLYSKSGELALTVLSAMEQVGDGMALPYLTAMAAGKGVPSTLRLRKAEVQARAQHTVLNIRERIERHNQANVLLRAAQVPATYVEQLVRPAHGQLLRDGAELLRPDAIGESDSDHKEKSS